MCRAFFKHLHIGCQTCRIFQRYHQILIVTVQLLVSTTLITRTYALYERSRSVLALTCLTGLCAVAIGFWALMRIASTDYSPLTFANMSAGGCGLRIDEAAGTRYGIAWVGVVVFDTEILILTVWKTIKILRRWKKVHLWSIGPCGGRIAHVFLRDGCTYYGILTVMNLSQVLTFLVASTQRN
ncbi:hypothetical protein BD410DRAFT_552928 [Rickenella mellea]|uniref:Uncharacterized protein n=1 Tax=Rickenella mellea TaxID=50990 RepID=A0A4Y7PQ18_9AGAM|nr:hypothetical protein BD410DRAFT_552928 [Rickenella mellea]